MVLVAELPEASVTVTETALVPTCEQLKVLGENSQTRVAAEVQLSYVPVSTESFGMSKLLDVRVNVAFAMLKVGERVSKTATVAAASPEFPASSEAVKVTGFVPRSEQENAVWDVLNVSAASHASVDPPSNESGINVPEPEASR